MQFTAPNGEVFPCLVGRPEFTPPELIGVDWRTSRRALESDLFGLAIHIYMLLMDGAHPFQGGIWTGGGDRPEVTQLIKNGWFAGGQNSPLRPQRSAPAPTIWPPNIVAAWEQAFFEGRTVLTARPSATEWRDHLKATFDAMQ